MCAESMLVAEAKRLKARFGAKIADDLIKDRYHTRPYQKGPVVRRRDSETVIGEMQFSLIPSWSPERRVKFATHNARLESFDEKKGKDVLIFEKPTWRSAFKSRHCIVPITHFIEPIYTGKLAGNMVRFSEENGEILGAAAIWEEWVDKEKGEVIESYSIITHEPIPFVARIGHDRSPLFLSEKYFQDWLESEGGDPKEMVESLIKHRPKLSLVVEVDRPMKEGWQKRIPK